MQPKESGSEFSGGPNTALHDEDENLRKYILFNLGGELYGAPLLSIREVIKLREFKPVPYMVPYFKGVINLRGQIISVIDLRMKFSLKSPEAGAGLVLVVETKQGLIGTVIDSLVSVHRFEAKDIEPAPALETKIPVQFFSGVAKLGERLVNLIDLTGCISSDELRTIKSSAA